MTTSVHFSIAPQIILLRCCTFKTPNTKKLTLPCNRKLVPTSCLIWRLDAWDTQKVFKFTEVPFPMMLEWCIRNPEMMQEQAQQASLVFSLSSFYRGFEQLWTQFRSGGSRFVSATQAASWAHQYKSALSAMRYGSNNVWDCVWSKSWVCAAICNLKSSEQVPRNQDYSSKPHRHFNHEFYASLLHEDQKIRWRESATPNRKQKHNVKMITIAA